jgi:hypothetical protein
MYRIEKVIKANGGLVETRCQPKEMETLSDIEEYRKKMQKHYDVDVIFYIRDLREKHTDNLQGV